MRAAVLILVAAGAASGQFHSTVPLVVAPTTVKDAKGQFVDGLQTKDLVLYDDNVPQTIQMDWMLFPISLVVAVQTSDNSGAVLDKLGDSGILFTQLLAGEAGATAVISFSDEVTVHQDFTSDPDKVIHALRMLHKDGSEAHALDALHTALSMLQRQPAGRRRIVLMIGEKRDRHSNAKLPDVLEQVERLNAQVFWLTCSPFLQPFTAKTKTMEDEKPIDQRITKQACAWCPKPDERPAPPDLGPGGLMYGLGELVHMRQPDVAELFSKTTGGRTMGFLKKSALEETIQLVGEEVHRQYILSFQPQGGEAGKFHQIRVEVRGHPELQVTSRAGYWAVE